MALNYGWEQLFMACSSAIGSEATPQKRLATAVTFRIHVLTRDDLPSDEAWERVEKLMNATTCKPAMGDEGTIEATTSQMTNEEAAKWLQEIVSLFGEVAEESGRQELSS